MKSLDHNPAPHPPSGSVTPRNCGGDLERNARKALELRAGRRFGDREWAHMQRKLVEFCAILSEWEKEATREQ
jgi:hypothetical protein